MAEYPAVKLGALCMFVIAMVVFGIHVSDGVKVLLLFAGLAFIWWVAERES